MMSRSLRNAVLLCLVALATLLIYWPGLGGGFILDDYLFIVRQPALHVHALTAQKLAEAMGSQSDTVLPRPLSYLSFALNYYFTGLDPFWMKLTNLLIHVGNGLLLFGLLRAVIAAAWRNRLEDSGFAKRADVLALVITAAWMWAPINVSAVLYVYQRVESAANLFVLAGLWMYVVGRSRQLQGRSRGTVLVVVGTLGGAAIGILFKEDAALLPLYAFLLEWLVFGFRKSSGKCSRGVIALFAFILLLPGIAGAIFILDSSSLNAAWSIRTFTLYERLLTESRIVVDYAQWTVLPALNQLSFYHDNVAISRTLWNPVWTSPAILVLGVAVLSVFLLRRRYPLVALGIAWFLAAQALTATVIPLELVFEHRNYFASAGLLLALFSAIAGATVSAQWKSALMAILVLFYGATTTLRAAEWGDPLRLAQAQVQKNPHSARARLDLGLELLRRSGNHNSSPELNVAVAALEQAAKISGSSILPEAALIIAASSAKPGRRVDNQWWQSLDGKLRTQPLGSENLSGIKALTNCAMNRICAAAPEIMVPMYLIALQRYPSRPEILILYANYATFVLGDLPLARNLLAQALVLNPKNSEFRADLEQITSAMKTAGRAAPADDH